MSGNSEKRREEEEKEEKDQQEQELRQQGLPSRVWLSKQNAVNIII